MQCRRQEGQSAPDGARRMGWTGSCLWLGVMAGKTEGGGGGLCKSCQAQRPKLDAESERPLGQRMEPMFQVSRQGSGQVSVPDV